MPDVTVNPDQLRQAAHGQEQAAAAVGKGVQATENADLGGISGKLYETHGPISGPSNDAIIHKAHEREGAGRAIQQACQTLAAALNTAAAAYTGSDSHSAANLNNQMQS
jgi:hypothetical protein